MSGAGVVSAHGVGLAALFDGLAEGRCSVGPIRNFDASTFPTRVAAEVPALATDERWLGAHGVTPAFAIPSGALRDRKAAFALAAATEAWRAAGCGAGERGAWISIAAGLEQAFVEDFPSIEREGAFDWARDAANPLPRVRYRSSVDLGVELVARQLGLGGPRIVHASACAAGGLAVAHAASLIERGAADVVLCGATDSMINPLGMGGMSRIGAPSPRNETDACRPFDRRRDGLVMGEGAAMFVVEEEARARARGAAPLARVTGWGSTQDAYRATAPRPDGSAACRAMKRALRRARLDPARVGYVNAHGTGTPLNDPAEAQAIRGALGPAADRVPVSSIKGALGHLMAASGALELAACLLAFSRDLLPATTHHRERDPDIELDVIGEAPRPARVDVVLSNSFGFGGQNVSVVMERI